MVKNIEFQGNRNNFQSKLKDDLKKVKTSGKIMVFADKTTNMYEMSKEDYVKLINDNVTKTYQKVSKTELEKLNKELANKVKCNQWCA